MDGRVGWPCMKNKTLQTVAAFAGFLVSCAVFAAVALGFLGFFD